MESAKFWRWVRIHLSEENFDEIFSSWRFRSLKNVYFNRKSRPTNTQMATFFSGLEDCSITSLYCNWVRLTSVDAQTLAGAVVRMKSIMMIASDLTLEQQVAMFTAIVECQDLKLKRITIDCNDLSELDPSLLARAVVRLEDADLFCCRLNSTQVETIMETIILASERGELKLRKLNIMRGDITTVSDSTTQQVQRILLLFLSDLLRNPNSRY